MEESQYFRKTRKYENEIMCTGNQFNSGTIIMLFFFGNKDRIILETDN